MQKHPRSGKDISAKIPNTVWFLILNNFLRLEKKEILLNRKFIHIFPHTFLHVRMEQERLYWLRRSYQKLVKQIDILLDILLYIYVVLAG